MQTALRAAYALLHIVISLSYKSQLFFLIHILLRGINNYRAHIHQNNADNNTDEDPDDHWVVFELIDIDGGSVCTRLLENLRTRFTLGLGRPLVCRWLVAF